MFFMGSDMLLVPVANRPQRLDCCTSLQLATIYYSTPIWNYPPPPLLFFIAPHSLPLFLSFFFVFVLLQLQKEELNSQSVAQQAAKEDNGFPANRRVPGRCRPDRAASPRCSTRHSAVSVFFRDAILPETLVSLVLPKTPRSYQRYYSASGPTKDAAVIPEILQCLWSYQRRRGHTRDTTVSLVLPKTPRSYQRYYSASGPTKDAAVIPEILQCLWSYQRRRGHTRDTTVSLVLPKTPRSYQRYYSASGPTKDAAVLPEILQCLWSYQRRRGLSAVLPEILQRLWSYQRRRGLTRDTTVPLVLPKTPRS